MSKKIILNVKKGSIAEEVEIEKGDELISVNGNKIKDIIDYRYLTSDYYIELEIKKPNGEEWVIEIDKELDEDIGIEFNTTTIDDTKTCSNKCIFCFVDQMPKNQRDSLYVKDDDSRLSFLYGNYITLTNMKEEDIKRIIDYNISPINISIHTTNEELRKKMLSNKFASNINTILKRFNDNDIKINGQIVLCPDVNDGLELESTIKDLSKYQNLMSLAIVPVGLTKFREGLYKLRTVKEEEAKLLIDKLANWQEVFYSKFGRKTIYLSDEFYILSKSPLPEIDYYEEFNQLENGVGMLSLFIHEFKAELSNIELNNLKDLKTKTVLTGTLSYDIVSELINQLNKKLDKNIFNVIAVKNNFFGQTVTVSGLIVASDIINTIKNNEIVNEEIVINNKMLKVNTELFLDNLSVKELSQSIDKKVIISDADGKSLVNTLLEK